MTRISILLLLTVIAASAQEKDLGLQLEENPPMRIIVRTPPEPAAITDTFEGGYFRNVVDRPYPHFRATECEFEVCNDGNTFLNCIFVIKGSIPFGYTDYYGKGGPNFGNLNKHSFMSIDHANNPVFNLTRGALPKHAEYELTLISPAAGITPTPRTSLGGICGDSCTFAIRDATTRPLPQQASHLSCGGGKPLIHSTVVNETTAKLTLRENVEKCTIRPAGPVVDLGKNNRVVTLKAPGDAEGCNSIFHGESLAGWHSLPAGSKHLLLDSRIIEKTEGVELRLGRVTKHPANPLFGEDKPWEQRFDNPYANIQYGDIYLGLVAVFRTGEDRVHTELAWSPDTVTWHRIQAGTPFIGNSPREGDYDWGCVYAADGPVTLDGELRIYYGGSNGKHTGWREGFLCLATLRPDGWAGDETTGEQPGEIIAKAIDVTGSTLRISADIAEGGSIRVVVIDDPGRTLATCRSITKDVTDGEVAWDGPTPLKAERVALKFELKNAKLYSFVLADNPVSPVEFSCKRSKYKSMATPTAR